MRAMVTATTLLAALLLAGGARAAPWCAHYNTGLNDCGFYSYRQCKTALSGVGGVCLHNGFETPYGSARRPYRRGYYNY